MSVALLPAAPPLCAAQSGTKVVWIDPAPHAELRRAARAGFGAQLDMIELPPGARAALSYVRSLAQEQNPRAVVWTEEAKLYVYDAAADRIVGERQLPANLDAAAAAAVVLSVKTYLNPNLTNTAASSARAISRESTTPAARSGGPNPSMPDESPQRAPLSAADADIRGRVTSTDSAGGSTRSETQRDVPDPEPSRSNSEDSNWQLELAAIGGMRHALVGAGPELRFAASALLQTPRAPWAVGVELGGGSGFRTQLPAATAQLFDISTAVSGQCSVLVLRTLRAAIALGPALHWLSFALAHAAGPRASAQRLRPGLQASLRLTWYATQRLFVGATASAELPLWTQRYWLGDDLTFETRRVSLQGNLALGIPISL